MEADWAVEVGEELPRIVVPWSSPPESGEGLRFLSLAGGTDSGRAGSGVEDIPEARLYPALARALVALNATDSPVFTSKCDVWAVPADEIDALDLDADTVTAGELRGLACYVDVVLRDAGQFASFSYQEQWMRRITGYLQGVTQRSSRVELVLRQAEVFAAEGFAITIYAMGCGIDVDGAKSAWGAGLDAVVLAVCNSDLPAHPFPGGGTLQ